MRLGIIQYDWGFSLLLLTIVVVEHRMYIVHQAYYVRIEMIDCWSLKCSESREITHSDEMRLCCVNQKLLEEI